MLDDYYPKVFHRFCNQNYGCRRSFIHFIYFGSTGKPKGMLHTTAGYMVYTAYTFKMYLVIEKMISIGVPQILVGLLVTLYPIRTPLNGATTVIFEGVPTYPEPDRFWAVIENIK